MSGAASTLHNININFAAAAPRTMRCHPSPVEAVDLRQRRHGFSPTSATTRSALGQPAELGGVRPLGGSHVGSSFPTNPAPAPSSPRHR
jgi:hypothetical protein